MIVNEWSLFEEYLPDSFKILNHRVFMDIDDTNVYN